LNWVRVLHLFAGNNLLLLVKKSEKLKENMPTVSELENELFGKK
jgi:hypothetical protein